MSQIVTEIVSGTQERKVSERVAVAVEQLQQCRSLTDAYRLSYAVSGRGLKQIAIECGWQNESALSRILGSGGDDDRRWMPHDRILPFMVACGNSVPLQWLGLQWEALTGRTRSGAQAAQVLGVTDRLDAIEANIQLVLDEMRKIQRGQYSITQELPVWLMMELVKLETRLCGGAA